MNIKHITKQWPFRPMPVGWRKKEWDSVREAKTIADLVPISHRVMDHFSPNPVFLVSGPISTGGILKPGTEDADIKANLQCFNQAVETLFKGGLLLFNQIPFEDLFVPVNKAWKIEHPDTYCMPILEDFYRGLFDHKHLQGIVLIPGWESSFGANWEVKTITSLRKNVLDLPVDWHKKKPEEVAVHIASLDIVKRYKRKRPVSRIA